MDRLEELGKKVENGQKLTPAEIEELWSMSEELLSGLHPSFRERFQGLRARYESERHRSRQFAKEVPLLTPEERDGFFRLMELTPEPLQHAADVVKRRER
jgi:hypothetical protein